MALTGVTVDWPTGVITVPRASMTLVQTIPTEIRNLNLNEFRLALKALEETPDGMVFTKTHDHNTEVLLGGIVYARIIEILDPYTITFENGQYAVNLVGANSNVGDRVNVNQVSIRSQNSAGLISNSAIEYSSFNGAVTIDVSSGNSGTLFPVGTLQAPVNNMADALLIAAFRGFSLLNFLSDWTFDNTTSITDFTIQGQGAQDTVFMFESGSTLNNCEATNAHIMGTGSGIIHYKDCYIHQYNLVDLPDLSADLLFHNTFHKSWFNLPTLYSGVTTIVDSWALPDENGLPPVINLNDSFASLQLRNWSGLIRLENVTNDVDIRLFIGSGGMILNSATVTDGDFLLYGVGTLEDENGNRILSGIWNSGVTIDNELINRDTISEANQLAEAVYINVDFGVTGTTFPIGTSRTPSNNIDDAVTIAENLGIERLRFTSDFTFGSGVTISDYTLIGEGTLETTLTCVAGSILAYCQVQDATVTGNSTGIIGFTDSKIADYGSVGLVPSSIEIIATRCLFDGTTTLPSNYSGKLTAIDCYSNVPGNNTPILDFGNSTATMQARNYTGGLELRNITSGNTMSVDLVSGNLKLHSSVTNGTVTARGVGKMVESATGDYIPTGTWNGNVLVTNDVMSKGTISEAVWDEPIGDHLVDGTTGKSVGASQFGGVVAINTSGVTGTTFPIGTDANPSNNLDDAKTIAAAQGINHLHFMSNFTLQAGDNVSGYVLHSDIHNTLTLTPGCITFYTNFDNLNLQGTLNGYGIINACSVSGLTGFYGIMDRCTFNGALTISTDSTKNAIFIDCYTGDVPSPPTIDCAGDGAKVSMRGLTGAALFTNKTGSTQNIFIDLYSARVGFDSTVTTGNIAIRGIGYVYLDDSTGTTFDTEGLMSKATVAEAVWDEPLANHTELETTGEALLDLSYNDTVYIDTINGFTGSTYPVGMRDKPVNNITDALLLVPKYDLNKLHIIGALTIDGGEDITGLTIKADRSSGNSLIITSSINTGITYYQDIFVSGALQGGSRFTTCVMGALTGYDGGAKNCLLTGDIDIVGSGSNYFTDCDTYVTVDGDAKILDVGDKLLNIIRCRGVYEISNKTGSSHLEIDIVAGRIIVDSGCVAGEVHVRGIGDVVDNSGAGCTVVNDALSLTEVSNYVWDEPIINHTTSGTYGNELATQDDLLAGQQIFSYVLTGDSAISVTLGSIGSGDYTDTLSHDENFLEIVETTTGYEVDFTFNSQPDQVPRSFQFQGRYQGNPAHVVNVYAYNHETLSFELITSGGSSQLEHSTTDYLKEFTLNPNHVNPSNNEIIIKILHSSPGQITNRLWIDKINVVTSVTAPTLTLEEIVNGVWDEPLSGHTVPTSPGSRIQTLSDITIASVISGTTTSITTDLSETRDDFYVGQIIRFTDGNLQNYTRVVTGYDGTTKTLTFSEPMIEIPSIGSTFYTIATYAVSPSDIATEVWNYPLP